MDYKIAFLLFTIITIIKAVHLPEVHEEDSANKSDYSENVFNYQEYQKNAQHDLQKLRYKQQQVSDQKTLNVRHARYLNDQEFAATEEKPRNSRKVNPKFASKPKTYQVSEASDRQDYFIDDHGVIQKAPKVLQQNLGGFVVATQTPVDQIAVLNSLLEKAPSAQLKGLQQLLNTNIDHKPIKEEVIDIPNTQRQPNIKVQQLQPSANPNIKVLQAQLDAVTSPKAHNSLAAAQEQAIKHIRAQHALNEQARIEAENAAKAEKEAKKNEEAALKDKQRKITQRKRIQEERARVAALAYKQHQNPKKPVQVHEESQNYYTHHQAPQHNYDESADVSKYYVPPEFTAYEGKDEHGHHELQYAAKYAFGYRIRDIHHGNDFGHEETKDGESTKGHYHVLLPDGRVQNVQYYVDPTGYHADVSYDSIHHSQHEE